MSADDPGSASHSFDEMFEADQASMRKEYRFFTLQELYDQPDPEWLIDQILPRKGVAAIYGASGSGKTFLALDLALSLATCGEWFGRELSENVPVAYCPLEAAGGVRRRVKAWHLSNPGRMHDVERTSEKKHKPFVVMAGDTFNLASPDNVTALADGIHAIGCGGGIVVLDTLACASAGVDENSAKDVGVLVDGAKNLQRAVDGLVLLVHHSGKDQARGMRGSSALHAALDAVIEVYENVSGKGWRLTKSKDSESGVSAGFILQAVEVNYSTKPITSCAVIPIAAAPVPAAPREPQAKNQKAVLKALRGGGKLPKAEAENLAYNALVQAGVESRRCGARAGVAIKALISQGYLKVEGGDLTAVG